MYTSIASKRRQNVLSRVRQANPMYQYCRVIGCGKPATAGTSKGLNQRFCRKHEDHYDRHGSPYKKSYTAAEVAPYRKAASAWVLQHENEHEVRLAINGVVDLYYRAGPAVPAFRLVGRSPEEQARAMWASLRQRNVHPREVVAIWLAIAATIHNDSRAEGKQEFFRVQAAKVIHRMAGGTHKRWVREVRPGTVVITELHKHPHSRGRVLRHLGKQLEGAAHLAVAPFLTACLSARVVRADASGPLASGKYLG